MRCVFGPARDHKFVQEIRKDRPHALPEQAFFPGFNPVEAAVAEFAAAGSETRGAIYTRPEIAEFMLDLGSYRSDRALQSLRLLEPSFGAGDFLFPAVRRLLASWRLRGQHGGIESLVPAIRAVELHTPTFLSTREELRSRLNYEGLAAHEMPGG